LTDLLGQRIFMRRRPSLPLKGITTSYSKTLFGWCTIEIFQWTCCLNCWDDLLVTVDFSSLAIFSRSVKYVL